MNQHKINALNKALSERNTISERLDYYKINYLDKYPGDKLFEYFETQSKAELKTGMSDGFEDPLRIPISGVTGQYLTPLLIKPSREQKEEWFEYKLWMLYFEAEVLFNKKYKPEYDSYKFDEFGLNYLKGQLKMIKDIQLRSNRKLGDGSIDIKDDEDLSEERLFILYKNDLYSKSEGWIYNPEPHIESICLHKFCLNYLKKILPKVLPQSKSKKVSVSEIDATKLAFNIASKGYINNQSRSHLIEWFEGKELLEPINILKPIVAFTSIIAEMQEQGYLNISKTACIEAIESSFQFKGKRASKAYIKNKLNQGSITRIQKHDTENYIDLDSCLSN